MNPKDINPNDESKSITIPGIDLKAEDAARRSEAARRMGAATSERKRAAVQENGKKGGRPRGRPHSPETKAKMQAAQQRRRAEEKGDESSSKKGA